MGIIIVYSIINNCRDNNISDHNLSVIYTASEDGLSSENTTTAE